MSLPGLITVLTDRNLGKYLPSHRDRRSFFEFSVRERYSRLFEMGLHVPYYSSNISHPQKKAACQQALATPMCVEEQAISQSRIATALRAEWFRPFPLSMFATRNWTDAAA
jgi:hypothetical protein